MPSEMSSQPWGRDDGRRLRHVAGVVAESFDPIDVVFDTTSGIVRTLNPTATAIFRVLAQPSTVGEILEKILGASAHTDHDRVEDVLRFLDELQQWDVIELC